MFAIFFITCNNRSVSSRASQKMLSFFSMFNVFTMLPKNELQVSAIFALSVKTLPSSISVILLFLDPYFFVESGDTVLQSNLLSVTLLRFKFSKYCRFLHEHLYNVCLKANKKSSPLTRIRKYLDF